MIKYNYPVKEYVNNVTLKPYISICVVTYNHVKYISQCLNGILQQECDYDYEILLGEDQSSDGTREVCIEYAKSYPKRIRLFLHNRRNVIYINNLPSGRFNFLYNLIKARGKYIAFCEGDDYWIDPYKLQKQVDFLETNPDYGMTFTKFNLLFERINKIITKENNKYKSCNIYNDLLIYNFICTATVLAKSNLIQEAIKKFDLMINEWMMVDRPLWLYIALKSKIGYLNEITTVYRKRTDSRMNKSYQYKLKHFISSFEVRLWFIEEFGCDKEIKDKLQKDFYNKSLKLAFLANEYKIIKETFEQIKKSNNQIKFINYVYLLGSRCFLLRAIIIFIRKGITLFIIIFN